MKSRECHRDTVQLSSLGAGFKRGCIYFFPSQSHLLFTATKHLYILYLYQQGKSCQGFQNQHFSIYTPDCSDVYKRPKKKAQK